ncbi:MAG TPA: hypothetical protein VLB12_10785 [Gemmatimonadales bacterium]|nr:hypothetical protein [Gemmatimonadales bacterium]
MSTFKPQQRHLTIEGRAFHFVSYEGREANERRAEKAEPAMWYLMLEGRRCPTVRCLPDQSETEIDKALLQWVEDQGLTPLPAARPPRAPTRRSATERKTNWW